MFKKINWPILVTVVCVLLFVGIILYGYSKNKISFFEKKSGSQNIKTGVYEEQKIVRVDYIEVARKTLDWIDKQRNEEGWYILGKTCGPKDCEHVVDDKEVGNKDGLIATWARLNFYEQHKDSKDLEIVKKDIDIFYEKYKDKDLSDSLWLCKVSYEMAQSKYIIQEQKDKLKELCLKKKFLGDEEIKKYWPERFKRATGITYPPITWAYYSLQERYFDNYFGSITDLVYKYLWFKGDDYISLINNYFSEIDNLIKNKKSLDSQNICLFGISVLDMYKQVDKSENRLDYSFKLYDHFNNNGNDKYFNNPVCGLFVRDLYELKSEKKYLNKLINISNLIIKNSQRIERDKSGEGFVRSDLSRGGFSSDRNIVENSLVVELVRK